MLILIPTSANDSDSAALIELRITARARKASHVNQHLNLMCRENLPELFTAASRMSDGPNYCQLHILDFS